MNYKLLVSDIDGTLIKRNQTFSEETCNLLRKISNSDIFFVSATGRMHAVLPDILKKKEYSAYAIVCNGAQVYDNKENKIIYSEDLNKEDVYEIFKILKKIETNFYVDCFSDDNNISDKNSYEIIDCFFTNPLQAQLVKEHLIIKKDICNYLKETGQAVQKMNIFIDPQYKKQLMELIAAKCKSIEMCQTNPFDIEITQRGVSKGKSLTWLQNYLNIRDDEVMVFGDSNNDVSMFKEGYFKVAIRSGDENLKSQADYIADTCENDGVRKVIEEKLKESSFL